MLKSDALPDEISTTLGDQNIRLFAGRPACEPCRVVRWMVRPRGRLAGCLPWSLMGMGVLDLRYRHVDVFSRRALQGNGLGVVLDAEHLPPAGRQGPTRE